MANLLKMIYSSLSLHFHRPEEFAITFPRSFAFRWMSTHALVEQRQCVPVNTCKSACPTTSCLKLRNPCRYVSIFETSFVLLFHFQPLRVCSELLISFRNITNYSFPVALIVVSTFLKVSFRNLIFIAKGSTLSVLRKSEKEEKR